MDIKNPIPENCCRIFLKPSSRNKCLSDQHYSQYRFCQSVIAQNRTSGDSSSETNNQCRAGLFTVNQQGQQCLHAHITQRRHCITSGRYTLNIKTIEFLQACSVTDLFLMPKGQYINSIILALMPIERHITRITELDNELT